MYENTLWSSIKEPYAHDSVYILTPAKEQRIYVARMLNSYGYGLPSGLPIESNLIPSIENKFSRMGYFHILKDRPVFKYGFLPSSIAEEAIKYSPLINS